MEDSGDDFLFAEALADPAVIAALALCSFRPASPPDELAPSPAAAGLPPVLGCHAPRSERRMRRLSNSKEAAASRWRPSPMTPLEHRGGSGASENCSEEILTKRGVLTGPETKVVVAGKSDLPVFRIPDSKSIRWSSAKKILVVVAGKPELSVFRIPDTKPFRRSSAKKKLTLPELGAMHQSLLEHRKFLLKVLEAKRKSKVALVARNWELKKLKVTMLVARKQELNKLKMRLESRKRPNTAAMPEEVHPKRFRLPDLNIPFVPESD